jgi:hypothetical protein
VRTSRLTDLYAAKGPFATVTIDVSHDSENGEHEHELRVRGAASELSDQGAPEEVVTAVTERLSELVNEPAPVSRTVVATADGVLFDDVSRTRVDIPTATWSALPDLASWVEHEETVTQFVLALVDHEGGDVAVYDSDVPEPEEQQSVGGETHHAHRVPVGGWSAMRYQNVTENVWERNAQAVAEAVVRHVRHGVRLVLLAGDPQSKPLVVEHLGELPATVVQLDTGTRAQDGGDEALAQAVREALLEQVVARRLDDAHTLRDRMGRGEAVATGVDDVADAFVRGQVETLLVDPAALREHDLDPGKHPGLVLGAETPSQPVRADQALVAAAVGTGADVSVARSAVLGGAPVAALLRWDQLAVGSEQS